MITYKRNIVYALYCTIACVFISVSAIAQQCDSIANCHCHTLNNSPAGIMVGHTHPKGTWMVSYRYMFMNMNGNRSGTQQVDEQQVFSKYIMSPTDMQMHMHMLMGMYGITDKLSVMAMLNYQTAGMHMNMFGASAHQHGDGVHAESAGHMDMHTSGLADTKVYLSYTLFETSTHSMVASAGVNIPTGSIQQKGDAAGMYAGTRMPYMMQLGSGTVDCMPGITYNRFSEKWHWGAQVTGVYRPFTNSVGYRLGNEGMVTSWLAYGIAKHLSLSIRGEAFYQQAISGRDVFLFSGMEPAASYRNYGGKRLNASIGFTYGADKGLLAHHKLAVEYGKPLWQDLNGIQLAQQHLLTAAWIFSF